jgi:uncharacterized repeat protein (TIGR01451 family)
VVGAGQQLSISNQVTVVGGGPAVPGAQLEYVVNVVNTATVPAFNVVVTDDLNASQPGQLAYLNQSATINGSAAGVSFAGSTITANYNGQLAPGAAAVLKFRATLNPTLVGGTVVTNTAMAAWNNPTQTVSASITIVVGSIPGVSVLNGSAWHDANFDEVQGSAERALNGWAVELYRDNQLWKSVQTDANGAYHIIDVEAERRDRVFATSCGSSAPGAGANTAMLGPRCLAVHQRNAADHGYRRAGRCRSAGPEPGDTSERRPLQLEHARSDCRGDTHSAGCPQHLALAGGLLRRCRPTRADHAGRRLLQVRPQLRQPGLSERW